MGRGWCNSNQIHGAVLLFKYFIQFSDLRDSDVELRMTSKI